MARTPGAWMYAGRSYARKTPITDGAVISRVNRARIQFSDGRMVAEALDDLSDHLEIVANSNPSRAALEQLGDEWRRLVKQSTWVSPIPAQDNSIIVQLSGGGRDRARLVLGWYAYKGPAWRARGRLNLRLKIFIDEVVPAILSQHGFL